MISCNLITKYIYTYNTCINICILYIHIIYLKQTLYNISNWANFRWLIITQVATGSDKALSVCTAIDFWPLEPVLHLPPFPPTPFACLCLINGQHESQLYRYCLLSPHIEANQLSWLYKCYSYAPFATLSWSSWLIACKLCKIIINLYETTATGDSGWQVEGAFTPPFYKRTVFAYP